MSSTVDNFWEGEPFFVWQKDGDPYPYLHLYPYTLWNNQSATETSTSVPVCHRECVRTLWETDGEVWVTTRGHDTSWHAVGPSHPTTPPSFLNLPPDLFLSPPFPLFFNLSMGVCVFGSLGWKDWTPSDTWRRWDHIRDVPAGRRILYLHHVSPAGTWFSWRRLACCSLTEDRPILSTLGKVPQVRRDFFLSFHNEPMHDSRATSCIMFNFHTVAVL